MFTGLIEQTGVLKSRGANHLSIRPARRFNDVRYGESIAVNGCCLTVERETPDGTIVFFTLAETLRCTNLGEIPLGGMVNLERALRLGDRLGGHIVSGHVDGTGRVLSARTDSSGDLVLRVALAPELAPEVVEKGSIAVDGISLTVVEVTGESFTVHLIPVTQHDTSLIGRKPGEIVNLETDLLAKYVRKQLAPGQKSCGITMETLAGAGFL